MSLLPMWKKQDRNPIASLQTEMNRLFQDFFGGRSLVRNFWGEGEETFLPPVDVRETEDKVIVEAELPGMEPKDVDIQIEGETLMISGERKHEKEEKARGYHRLERSFGWFQRSVELPPSVDPEKVEATCKDGVLTVELAKKEEAKRKTIQVKVK